MAHQNQEWHNSLCDCSPCSSCLLGTCCPCILIGNTSERLRDPSMQSAETCNSDCMIFCAIQSITGFGFIHAMIRRGEIRERFGIKGSGCGDYCTTYWCLCCALIQQDNEVQSRQAQGPITQGYQSNKQGMTMAPQQQQQQQQIPQQQYGYQQQQQQPPQPIYQQQQQQPQQQYNPQQPQY